MGLLDQLGNLNPEQTQGLLAAASQLLQAGGPSRTPIGFGQALGAGIQGFQGGYDQAQQRKLQLAQAQQTAKLMGLKIQDAESDVANQQAARDRAEQLRKFYIAQGTGSGSAGAPSAFSALGGNLAPTVENSQRLEATKASQPGANQNQGIYQQRLQLAQALRNQGFGPEADAVEAAALKFQPKVKEWQKISQNGKVLYAPYFEDGTSGQPVPYEVAEKLQFQNTGGQTLGLNPFTGASVASFTNSQSPDNAASVAATLRGQNISRQNALDQLLAPTYNADVGGFIGRPNKNAPGGTFTPLEGLSARSPKLTEDQAKATGWLVQADNAYQNLKSVAFDKEGKITAAAKPGTADAIAAIPGLGGVGNYFRSADRQKFNQSSSSLAEALLRAATGAGVNKEEAKQKVDEITPVWGEDPSVTEQKFNSIPLYIESLKARSGAGAAQASDILSKRPSGATGKWGIQKVSE